MFCSVSFPKQLRKVRHLKFIEKVLFVCFFLFRENVRRKLSLRTPFEKTRSQKLEYARRPITDLPARNSVLRSENSWHSVFGVNFKTLDECFIFKQT